MFLVADQPLLDHLAIERLIGAFEVAGSSGICYPVCNGRRGHPVIFASRLFPELKLLRGDCGGRSAIDRYSDICIPVKFASDFLFRDVDCPGDLDKIGGAAMEAGTTRLVQALELETSRVISLCDSGGTNLMAALVQDFALDPTERLLATTTTKMGVEEKEFSARASG